MFVASSRILLGRMGAGMSSWWRKGASGCLPDRRCQAAEASLSLESCVYPFFLSWSFLVGARLRPKRPADSSEGQKRLMERDLSQTLCREEEAVLHGMQTCATPRGGGDWSTPVPSDNRCCCRGRDPSPMRLDLRICRLPVRGVPADGGVRLQCRPNQRQNAMVPSYWPCLERHPSAGRLPRSTTRFPSTTTTAGLRKAGKLGTPRHHSRPREHKSTHQIGPVLDCGESGEVICHRAIRPITPPFPCVVRPQKSEVMMCRLQRRRGLLSASHVLRSAQLVDL